jgi:threonine synthase
LQNLCVECGKPLLVRYDLEKAAQTLTKESLKTRPQISGVTRKFCRSKTENIVSFGEGFTPLLKAENCRNSADQIQSLHQRRINESDAEF